MKTVGLHACMHACSPGSLEKVFSFLHDQTGCEDSCSVYYGNVALLTHGRSITPLEVFIHCTT